ncbi:MAG TPA: PIN domain-containing protein [Thermoanaerobaculia bacterium]|nr:PIN domain-containing protein [Thermoanaerobaculia bacterium]
MKALFDTSVLVAALVGQHPRHEAAVQWLNRALAGEFELLLCSHTLAELFATLTSMPLKPRLSAKTAEQLIADLLANPITLVPLEEDDCRGLLVREARLPLTGGVVYDALIARAAEKAGVEVLLTLNPRDFLRAWPEGYERVRTF